KRFGRDCDVIGRSVFQYGYFVGKHILSKHEITISSHQRLGSNAVIVQDRVSFRSDRAALTVFDQEAQAKIPITEGVRYTCCPVWIEIGDELGDAACNFGKAIGPYDYAALLIPHETPRINITERLPFFDDEVTEETRR